MPTIPLPLSKGTGISEEEYDWVDVFPINLIANDEPVLSGRGFMRPWVGLESVFVETSGVQPIGCTGARFVNTRMGVSLTTNSSEEFTPESEFRAIGNSIYRGHRVQLQTTPLPYFRPLITLDIGENQVTNNRFIRMSNSYNYFVFIYAGRLYYFSPRVYFGTEISPDTPLSLNSITADADNASQFFNVLKDWDENEYIPARMEGGMVWIPNLQGGSDRIGFSLGARSTIDFQPIIVSINIGETLTSNLWLVSNQVAEDDRVGIYLGMDMMFYAKVASDGMPIPLTGGDAAATMGHHEYTVRFPAGMAQGIPSSVDSIAFGATFSENLYIDSIAFSILGLGGGLSNIRAGNGMFSLMSGTLTSPPSGTIQNTAQNQGTVGDLTIRTGSVNWQQIQLVSTSSPLPRSNYNDNDDRVFTDILDVDFHGGRFVFLRNQDSRFYSTSLVSPVNGSGEQRPDYQAAAQDVRNESGGFPTAIRAWHNYVVVFSPHSTQYFQLTGNAEQIYRRIDSLTIDCGTQRSHTVCEYKDSFVVIGSPEGEDNSVYFLSKGSYRELANRTIQQLLRKEDLGNVLIEPVKFDNHDGFIIHLANITLFYNDSYQAAPWSIISSSTDGDSPYVGVHHIYDENLREWHCGVRSFENTTAYIMRFNYEIASHAIAAAPTSMDQMPVPMPENRAVLYQVTTAIAQIRNVRIHDIEIDIIYNQPDQNNDAITIAKTTDGINFIEPYNMLTDNPDLGIDQRLLLRNYGYSDNNIGFMISWNNIRNPLTISHFRLRYEK